MAFKFIIKKTEIIKGAVVFGLFDTLAALLLGEFYWLRMLGIIIIGGSIYAIEIPSYFAWLEQRSQSMSQGRAKVFKTLMTVAYFNPLWIARHILFIYLLTQQNITWEILSTALQSFMYVCPVSLLCNFIIQNHIPVRHRFLASSLFSGCTAIFYAVSAAIFK